MKLLQKSYQNIVGKCVGIFCY